MGIKRIVDLIHRIEEQRRLKDPFYGDFWDKTNKISKSLEMEYPVGTKVRALIPKLEIAVEALWFKYQETEYFLENIQSLTSSLAKRTFSRSLKTPEGPTVEVSMGIHSDRVAFEFNSFLQAAKSACDKLAKVSRIILAAQKGVLEVRGLKDRSIRDFVNSAKKMESNPMLSLIIEAWDSWINDLNECRDYVEHHGRYFLYVVHPHLNFPIVVPPPYWLKGLTRGRINSLSNDELPSGNIDMPVYCSQTTDNLRQLIILF